jgi:hypothetical protein
MNQTNLSELHVAGNSEPSQVNHDRAWWRVESRRLDSDWLGLLRLQTEVIARWRGAHDPDLESGRRMRQGHAFKDGGATSLDALAAHLDGTRRCDGAPQSTFDALHCEVRSRGLAALEHPSCRQRLVELSAEQLRELMAALIRTRAKFPGVTDEILLALDGIRRP